MRQHETTMTPGIGSRVFSPESRAHLKSRPSTRGCSSMRCSRSRKLVTLARLTRSFWQLEQRSVAIRPLSDRAGSGTYLSRTAGS